MHISVLLEQSLEPLVACNGTVYVDCTFGGGGHSAFILEKLPHAKVIAFDKDPDAHARARTRFSEYLNSGRLKIVHEDFKDIGRVLKDLALTGIDGLIADLGVSSFQIDQPERGFSFLRDGPLDMRMNTKASTSAYDLINSWPASELEKIFYQYGEEKYSRPIARKIVEQRVLNPIKNTLELANLISNMVPASKRNKSNIHPATRVFQALRISVNNELESLEALLASIPDCLNTNGVAAIISFHSLEDRIVKNRFRELSQDCICPPPMMNCERCHKPPGRVDSNRALAPTEKEILENPRARSAKLRIFYKNSVK